jgi:hypothetical protein
MVFVLPLAATILLTAVLIELIELPRIYPRTITVNVGVAGGCITTTTLYPKLVIPIWSSLEVFVEKGIGRSL